MALKDGFVALYPYHSHFPGFRRLTITCAMYSNRAVILNANIDRNRKIGGSMALAMAELAYFFDESNFALVKGRVVHFFLLAC